MVRSPNVKPIARQSDEWGAKFRHVARLSIKNMLNAEGSILVMNICSVDAKKMLIVGCIVARRTPAREAFGLKIT